MPHGGKPGVGVGVVADGCALAAESVGIAAGAVGGTCAVEVADGAGAATGVVFGEVSTGAALVAVAAPGCPAQPSANAAPRNATKTSRFTPAL
jgi:hypothetical protein